MHRRESLWCLQEHLAGMAHQLFGHTEPGKSHHQFLECSLQLHLRSGREASHNEGSLALALVGLAPEALVLVVGWVVMAQELAWELEARACRKDIRNIHCSTSCHYHTC